MTIRNFKDRRGPILFDGQCPKGFPPDLVRVARRKLRAIDAAIAVRDLVQPPGNRLEKPAAIGQVNGRYVSTINGGYVSFGVTTEPMMSKSSTTTDVDPKFRKLPPLHVGEVLREEFWRRSSCRLMPWRRHWAFRGRGSSGWFGRKSRRQPIRRCACRAISAPRRSFG